MWGSKDRELARAIAAMWNEEIRGGCRVVIQEPGERVEGITIGAAWENFGVAVIQVCDDYADLRTLPVSKLRVAE